MTNQSVQGTALERAAPDRRRWPERQCMNRMIFIYIIIIAGLNTACHQKNTSINELRLQIWNHSEATKGEKIFALKELLTPKMTAKDVEAMLGPGKHTMFSGSGSKEHALLYEFPTGNIYIYYDPRTKIIQPPRTKPIQ